jgi:cysteine-rich repeat protein
VTAVLPVCSLRSENDRRMQGLRRDKAWLLVLAALTTSCNLIAAIDLGTARDEHGDPSQVCDGDLACIAKVLECDGMPEETPLHDDEQTPGDCRKSVCDGAGKVKSVPDPTDVEDDNNPCTLDRCIGTTPTTHQIQSYYECYTGPPDTKGKGICLTGVQRCDEGGQPVDECVGQMLPRVETCLYPIDEDCDGQVDEDGEGCVCGDGVVSVGMGEECDDANNDATDDCTTECKRPVCGDGFVHHPDDENCDDGNTTDSDLCPANCHIVVAQIATGAYTACSLFKHGRIKCWGGNYSGQLGLGDTSYRGDEAGEMGDALPAVDLGAGKTAQALAVGGFHTCALLQDGTVKCWGENNYGQLGLGDQLNRGDKPGQMGDALPTVDLGAGKTAQALAAGHFHTCALLQDGTVKCWGENNYGQLGLGDQLNRGDKPGQMGDALPIVDLGAGKTAQALAAGGSHTCALLQDGTVKCWGENYLGQLGLGDKSSRGDEAGEMGDTLSAVDLGAGKTAKALAAGHEHTCALLQDGTAKCWGWNGNGQLGLGDKSSRGDEAGEMGDALPAVDLGAGKTAKALAVGDFHTCALLQDGTVKCWGENYLGQLGLGDKSYRGDEAGEMGDALPAVDLGTGKTAQALAAGYWHTCALLQDDTVKCWGENGNGQLGLGDQLNRGDKPGQMGDQLPAIILW